MSSHGIANKLNEEVKKIAEKHQRCLNNAKNQNDINRCNQEYKRDQANMMKKIEQDTNFFQ